MFQSIQKVFLSTKKQAGFSLVEAVLATAMFALIATIFTGAIIYGQESTALAGARARAVLLAEGGLEAVRNIRDQNFSLLVNGTHGLALTNNQWTLSGSQDTTDIFTRQITISTVDANTKDIISSVIWQQTPQRTGSITATTRLTNWRDMFHQAHQLDFDASGAFYGGQSNRTNRINGIILRNRSPFGITVDKIKVSWISSGRRVELIVMGGTTVWGVDGPGTPLGKQPSGIEIDMADYTLPAGQEVSFDNIQFDGSMVGNVMTVEITMKDGTVKSVTFLPATN